MENSELNEEIVKDEETEKRDRLIYELIKDRFHLEWQRTNILDGKASGSIGFVGIIRTLQAGLGVFFLKTSLKLTSSITHF